MKLKILTPNATQITLANGHIHLYSYETLVAVKIGDLIYETEAEYSRTTSKHIALFKNQYSNCEVRKVPQDVLNPWLDFSYVKG